MATDKSPFVILRGIKEGNRFFSCNDGSDPTKLTDGTVAYTILGYADTVEEAQIIQPMLARTNGNNYPSDWFEKVMASGLMAQAEKNWSMRCG